MKTTPYKMPTATMTSAPRIVTNPWHITTANIGNMKYVRALTQAGRLEPHLFILSVSVKYWQQIGASNISTSKPSTMRYMPATKHIGENVMKVKQPVIIQIIPPTAANARIENVVHFPGLSGCLESCWVCGGLPGADIVD